MTTPLTPLEQAMMQDKILRDSTTSLVDKERRLAELELLLRLSASGAPLTSTSGGLNNTTTTSHTHTDKHHHSSHTHKHGHHGTSHSSSSSVPTTNASSSTEYKTMEHAISSSFVHIFDDTDPVRVLSSSLAAISHLPSNVLRPRSNQPELITAEIAALGSNGHSTTSHSNPAHSSSSSSAIVPTSNKYGLDLSHMHLTDEKSTDLTTLFASLSSATTTLRLLDIRGNDLQKNGASVIVDAVKRFTRLEAVLADDNPWGGKPGIGGLIDVCTKAAVMVHFGITIDESTPLPFTCDIEIIPPGLPKKAAGTEKGRGRSASPGKKKAPAKKAASPSKGKAGAKGAATHSAPTGTIAHLTSAIRNNSAITSVSIAGSTISREALLIFIAAWSPPTPALPHAPGDHEAKPAADPKAKPSAPAKSAPAAKPGAKKGGHAASHKAHKFVPLTCLNLTRCHIGALGTLDVSVALGPIPAPESFDPAARLGSITPYATTTSTDAAAAAKGTAAPKGTPGIVVPPAPPYVAGHSVHGCLQYLRVLNLSSCGLTSHGLIPLLESIALHCNYLSHLILRDNYIDDAGAAALAAAVRMNNERVHTLQSDAMAHAVLNHPLYLLSGKNPSGGPVPHLSSPDSKIAHHLAVANAAGLSAFHFTPLRVIDVRNNPLAISGDPSSHPGCVALVEALETIPDILSLVGPEPSIESTMYYKSITQHPSLNNEPLTDDLLVGLGAQYPFDLAAIISSARAARRGGAVGPSTLLSLPAGLTQRATSCIIKKCNDIEYQLQQQKIQKQNALGLPDTPTVVHSEEGYGTVIWRLHTPVAKQTILPGMSANPQILNHNGNKILEKLPDNQLPQEYIASASPHSLGSLLLQMGVPTGLIGHDEDSPIVRKGTAEWLLHTPKVVLEWRSSYTAPANIVPFAMNQGLVYHIFVSGPGGRPLQHITSINFTDGSRDRLHARTRYLEKIGIIPEPDANLLPSSTSIPSHENDLLNKRKITHWQESTGLDIPRPLGSHNDFQTAALALPSALTNQAITSLGTNLVAWPVIWHSVILPNHIITSVTDARLHIYAEVQQTSLRNMGSLLTHSETAAIANNTMSYGVHVLEAELVIMENIDNIDGVLNSVTGLSKSIERIQPEIAFSF